VDHAGKQLKSAAELVHGRLEFFEQFVAFGTARRAKIGDAGTRCKQPTSQTSVEVDAFVQIFPPFDESFVGPHQVPEQPLACGGYFQGLELIAELLNGRNELISLEDQF
jgi:hypothetical protein